MLIKTMPVGQLETNCYVVTNEATLHCVVIDPGDESNTILDYIEDNKLVCDAILLTHGHFDHVGAVSAIAEETGAKVYINELDDFKNTKSPHLPYTLSENGSYYCDNQHISAAGLDFQVLFTPGHTPGSVTLLCEDVLFTGDTLFRGSRGRTDLPGSSDKAIVASLKRICSLPGDYEVYPGHLESSTLERERMFNFYCRKAMSGE